MTEKDQIKLIEDAHGERIWQPVLRVNSIRKPAKQPEIVAINRLDSHSAAYRFAEKEAAKFATKEAAKPIAERRVVVGFGVRNIEAPAASQQQMRPVDSRLVNIDQFAEEIARTIAKMRQVSAAGYGLEVVEMKKEIFERVIREGVQLYREDCPLPFLRNGLQAPYTGLRLKVEDAEKLRRFYLGQTGDQTQEQEPTNAPATVETLRPLPAVVSGSNGAPQDPERRLARLRSIGGCATYRRGEWKFTGITALVQAEKSEERKRSDEKTIRDDLRAAAQNELDEKRAGAFDRLGQR